VDILSNQILNLLPPQGRLLLQDAVGKETQHSVNALKHLLHASLGVSTLGQHILHLLRPEHLGGEDGDLGGESVKPFHHGGRGEVPGHRPARLHGLCHSGGEADPHLVLKLGEPLVDPGVVHCGHRVDKHHLLPLLAGDSSDHVLLLI